MNHPASRSRTNKSHSAVGAGASRLTAEHPLHRRTNPVFAWQAEFGSGREWETWIADQLRHEEGSV